MKADGAHCKQTMSTEAFQTLPNYFPPLIETSEISVLFDIYFFTLSTNFGSRQYPVMKFSQPL
ncbi:MAG: hypothetical protein ABSB91_07470, partial [Sedimentisphaerales bacterium]